jgi:hypothetical protein
MSDVTQILGQIEGGDGRAAEKLLPLVSISLAYSLQDHHRHRPIYNSDERFSP